MCMSLGYRRGSSPIMRWWLRGLRGDRMTVDTLIVTCPTSPTCPTRISATNMPSLSWNSPKLCTHVFVSPDRNASANVPVTWLLMTPVWSVFAVKSVLNTKTVCCKQNENCKSREYKTWMTWNHVHVKRPNATKNIARVMRQGGSAQTYVNVMSVQIVTFTIMSRQSTRSRRRTLTLSMIGK